MLLLSLSSLLVMCISQGTSEAQMPAAAALKQPHLGDDPEEVAKEWMEQLEALTKSMGAAAKLFENLEGEESSQVWSHSFKLVECLASLIGGFLGTSPSQQYVKAIQELQEAFDQAIAMVQSQLHELVKDIQEDFMKSFLVPNTVILDDAVKALTEFSSSDHGEIAKKIWMAQMQPISNRADAWNSVALCLVGQLSSCPTNALNIILDGGREWPRPAILAQFAAYHYSLLASSATAICSYQALASPGSGCTFIELKTLQMLAGTLSKSVTEMKSSFWESTGADKVPAVIQAQVSQNANRGFDGAKSITATVSSEVQAFYLDNSMDDFFGISSWAAVVHTQSDSGGNWAEAAWATGWVLKYFGYNIEYMFMNGGVQSYGDSDCRSGSVKDMADCLHDMHNGADWVFQAGRRRYDIYWAMVGRGSYFEKYSDTDVRFALPGVSNSANSNDSHHFAIDGSAQDDATSIDDEIEYQPMMQAPLLQVVGGSGCGSVDASPIRPLSAGSGGGKPATFFHAGANSPAVSAEIHNGVPSDPESIMKDISNAFETAGAIADFFGPEGEAVGLALDLVASIFSLISGLLGLGQPDPVIEALRNLEQDIMGKLSAVIDSVQQAKSTAQLGAIANILNKAEVPLRGLVTHWNSFYPDGSKDGKINMQAANLFKESIGGDIAKYRDFWNILVQCLAGTNVDCVLQGETALQILLHDGQIYMRPRILTETLQYYFILLQKSSVAICAYAQLFLDDKQCTFLPGLKSGLSSVASGMKTATTNMKNDFWGSMGADKLPPVIRYFVDSNANKGFDGAKAISSAIADEISQYYLADGLDNFFGITGWAVVVTQQSGDGGNWASACYASGWSLKYMGYNVEYMFVGGAPALYDNEGCRSGSEEDMATCLHNENQAADWVFRAGRRRYDVFYAITGRTLYYHKYSDTDARFVTPGDGSAGANGLQPFSADGAMNSNITDLKALLV